MGTRGITEVIFQNEIIVSQYGQWDHYPSGQGITVLNILRDPMKVERLKRNLPLLYEVSSETIQILYRNHGESFSVLFPSLTRDAGSGVLEIISNAETKVPVYLDKDFKTDRLFCEGIYAVNFDDRTFTTVYGDDTLILSFDECLTITDHEYLIRTNCGVYKMELKRKKLAKTK